MKNYIIIFCLFLFACNDNCEYMQTDCEDNKVIVCDDEENWATMLDCNNISFIDGGIGNWKCCRDTNDEPICLPEEMCN
jgi:hypothetical protein